MRSQQQSSPLLSSALSTSTNASSLQASIVPYDVIPPPSEEALAAFAHQLDEREKDIRAREERLAAWERYLSSREAFLFASTSPLPPSPLPSGESTIFVVEGTAFS